MWRYLVGVVPILAMAAAPAVADYYIAGDFNAWNPADPAYRLQDDGGGMFSIELTGLVAESRHEFKITQGDWLWSTPQSGNSWFYADADGGGRGNKVRFQVMPPWEPEIPPWQPPGNRIWPPWPPPWYPGYPPPWWPIEPPIWWPMTAVGDWQGWDNDNPATAMTDLGGGLYYYEQILSPGWHEYKACLTGTWDAFGTDGPSENASTLWFETTVEEPMAQMWVDAVHGRVRVDVVPEPAALGLLALSSLLVARRRF